MRGNQECATRILHTNHTSIPLPQLKPRATRLPTSQPCIVPRFWTPVGSVKLCRNPSRTATRSGIHHSHVFSPPCLLIRFDENHEVMSLRMTPYVANTRILHRVLVRKATSRTLPRSEYAYTHYCDRTPAVTSSRSILPQRNVQTSRLSGRPHIYRNITSLLTKCTAIKLLLRHVSARTCHTVQPMNLLHLSWLFCLP